MYKFHKIFIRGLKTTRTSSLPSLKIDRIQQDEAVMKPFNHVGTVPSKHHKRICLAFNHWLNVSNDKIEAIGDILQTSHTASLLLDDIQDDSKLRYGVAAAHRVYGIAPTFIAATVAMDLVVKKVLELGPPSAMDIYLNGYLESYRGQGIDLYWTEKFLCPSKEEHLDMLEQKAASFFVTAIQLLQLFSENKKDYTRLATCIGIYYPILDDYYNLFNSEALTRFTANEKNQETTFGGDITECKFTLPIIHALQYEDVREQICGILKLRTSEPELKKYCISLLKRHGSDEYTKGILFELEEEIRAEIECLGGNPALTTLIDELSIKKDSVNV